VGLFLPYGSIIGNSARQVKVWCGAGLTSEPAVQLMPEFLLEFFRLAAGRSRDLRLKLRSARADIHDSHRELIPDRIGMPRQAGFPIPNRI
jgi:hypothetical protein